MGNRRRLVDKGNRVTIFGIKDQPFRLVVGINCQAGAIKIEFIDTCNKYDDINAGAVA